MTGRSGNGGEILIVKTVEQRLKGDGGVNHADWWEKNFPRKRNRKCWAPRPEMIDSFKEKQAAEWLSKKQKIASIGKDVKKSGILCIVDGIVQWCTCYRRLFGRSSKS